MDIFSKLKTDHDNVKKILKKIEETSNNAGKTRETLFAQLKNELLAHSKVEEAVFYATLLPNKDLKENVLEGLNEHRIVDMLLAELDSIPKDNPQWHAKFHFLKELIEHHVEDEEGEMFPKAKKALDDETAEELGELMTQREDAVKEALEPVV